MKKLELEERLIDFSADIISFTETIKKTYAGTHLSNQITRSGTSVSLNYGEAQSAESKRDFVHKIQIVLKELRETFVCLKLIEKSNLAKEVNKVQILKKESNELISIFVRSVQTVKSK